MSMFKDLFMLVIRNSRHAPLSFVWLSHTFCITLGGYLHPNSCTLTFSAPLALLGMRHQSSEIPQGDVMG